MKKILALIIGLTGLAAPMLRAQTVVNSWENSLEGWSIVEPGIWSTTGFSTTTGVTDGTFSWNLTASAGPDYGTALVGPSSTNLTALLANAATVSITVLTPTAGSFGFFEQFELQVNLPGVGSLSFDNGTYSQSPVIGASTPTTLTYTVPASIRQAMAAHPGTAANFLFAIGGGGPGTMFLDKLVISPLGLINSWENSQEGWTIIETNNWSSVGFSTNTNVTSGKFSWELTATSVDYGVVLAGPASTSLTALLSDSSAISMDIFAPAGGFGFGEQIDLEVNQPGGAGNVSLDNFTFNQSPVIGGPASTLSWPVSAAVRNALLSNPTLPTKLTFQIGGGAGGTMFIDNLRATLLPPAPAALSVRELWDDLKSDVTPVNATFTDDSSSVGFASGVPWVGNPAESPTNTQIMAFRTGFPNESSILMGLPGSLDGTTGCMVQQNNGFSFFPAAGGPTFWTDGDFLTRQLAPNNFIDFQAVGEYWFTMTIANSRSSLDANFVTFPSSGAGGIGFADGSTTNADFVAIGVTGLNLFFGPTNSGAPFGETNASKAVYISQGTLGQPGNLNSTVYNPLTDPNASPADNPPVYSQTNFTGGPYHVNALGTNTVGSVEGDGIVVLGHLKTLGNGSATLDAKYYTTTGGNPWNFDLDTNTSNITWDCSYAFNFGGTMTRMLIFQDGQFPFYMFGFRASTNFNDVVGLDVGRLEAAPLANTFVGFPINMTNLAVEANSLSFVSPPANYGTLNYQWFQNGVAIPGATSQFLNIASASTNDPNMPAHTDAGTYTSVATDPSGTWGSVTNSVVITVTDLAKPTVTSVQLFHDQSTVQITFSEPNLTGMDETNHYVFNNGVVATNVTVVSSPTETQVQIETTTMPLGTRVTLKISGVTNVIGDAIVATNITFWTDLMQTGVVSYDAWASPASQGDQFYFNTFLHANPHPFILLSESLNLWEGPTGGVNINGGNGPGTDFAGRIYGWFIPPVTTNYVFYMCTDDGGRLWLSTNESPSNMCVIACESDWTSTDQWTNMSDEFPTGPHRGDGTAAGTNASTPANFVFDNSVAAQSPATACDQNRSDQFIVAYYDSLGQTGLPGEPAGATDQANWALAESQVTFCILPDMTNNFWPTRDANGQALISLQAGKKYYMQLEHIQNTGGVNEGVTYKFAGGPDPATLSASLLTGTNIASLVPFEPTISIAETASGPKITYTGVLFSGNTPTTITNQVAISSGGPSVFTPSKPLGAALFFRTSE